MTPENDIPPSAILANTAQPAQKHTLLWHQIHRLYEVEMELNDFMSRINSSPGAPITSGQGAQGLTDNPEPSLLIVLDEGPDQIATYLDRIHAQISDLQRVLLG